MTPPLLPSKPVATDVARRDRRLLLRYILELESGSPPSDAALEALDVEALIRSRQQVPPPAANANVNASANANPFDSEDEDGPDTAPAAPASTAQMLAPLLLATPLRELTDDCTILAFQLYSPGEPKEKLREFARAQLLSPQLAAHLGLLTAVLKLSEREATSLRLPLLLLLASHGGGLLSARALADFRQAQAAMLLSSVPEERALLLRTRVLAGDLAALGELSGLLESAGWALPVAPVGIALYSTLVSCQWDYVDESSGTPVAEASAFLTSLSRLWPLVGCTPRSHAAHRLFSAVRRWSCFGSVDALQVARRDAAALASLFKDQSVKPSTDEEAHLRATLAPVFARCAEQLDDYHRFFPFGADKAFASLLETMVHTDAVLQSLPRGAGRLAVRSLMESSIRAAYARIVTAAGGVLLTVTQRVSELLVTELDNFSPVLEPSEPRAALLAVALIHSLFTETLQGWLHAPPAAEEALASLKGAEQLLTRLAQAGSPATLDCALLAEPFSTSWVDLRQALLERVLSRNLAAESWKLDSKGTSQAAYTVVELARGMNDAVESWFQLQVQQREAALALVAGLSSLLVSLCARLQTIVGDHRALLPSPGALKGGLRNAIVLYAR